ncbi:MAG: SAM-dependent methyltransferase, partial [Bacteroidetes bacterium]|nr:SAM-dependent methyltransferase [Bacteroidota bacterium]
MKQHTAAICPSCAKGHMSIFYEVQGVPVNSVLLLPTREEALAFPKGDIALGFCELCGFISNVAFDPKEQEYSARYEATQAYSPTFTTFHRNLAQRLIDRYDLRNKTLIEIGC